MNNVIDEVLAGAPRYTIKDNGGTTLYDNVQIDLATTVTTAGTPLNKTLFDSIKDDLNSRLLISSKATTVQAQDGTDDTNYMTAKKVQDKLDSLFGSAITGDCSGTANKTISLVDCTGVTNEIYTIDAFFTSTVASASTTSRAYLTINGSNIYGSMLCSDGTTSSSVTNASTVNIESQFRGSGTTRRINLHCTINTRLGTVTGTYYVYGNSLAYNFSYDAGSLTTIEFYLKTNQGYGHLSFKGTVYKCR